jgi:predicted MPP superfamily phosphohydrolase
MTWIWSVGALAALTLALWAYRHMRKVEPERIEVTAREVRSADLPEELDGAVICHVSDLHITADPRNSATVAEAIRSVQADLYVLTGDMIHGPRGVSALMTWLDDLANAMRPAVAVLGNAEHKRRIPTSSLVRQLEARGVRVLRNEVTEVSIGRGTVQIVGLDDPHTGHSRPLDAFARADTARWTVVLVHSPEGILPLEGRRADLVLAGHTHGGQILLPGIGWVSDNTHHSVGLISGWYDSQDLAVKAGIRNGPKALYVSRGLGTSGWPLRLRCRPELALLTLRRA